MARTPKQPNHLKDADALNKIADRLETQLNSYYNRSVDRHMPRIRARLEAAIESSAVTEDQRDLCRNALQDVDAALHLLRVAASNLASLPEDFNPNPPVVKLSLEDAQFCVPKDPEMYADIIDLSEPIEVIDVQQMGKKKMLKVGFTGTDGSAATAFLTPSHFKPVANSEAA